MEQLGASTTRADDGAADVLLGRRLRAGRQRAGLSLRSLASRLDISASALSQIETGRSQPSVRTLYSLVNELGLSFDSLFAGGGNDRRHPAGAVDAGRSDGGDPVEDDHVVRLVAPAASSGVVVRVAERRTIELESGVRWALLNDAADDSVEFMEVMYAVGGASGPGDAYTRHAGLEYGVVLGGCLEVSVGFETYRLGPGDSVSFDSGIPHRLATVGDEPVRAIWAVLRRRAGDGTRR